MSYMITQQINEDVFMKVTEDDITITIAKEGNDIVTQVLSHKEMEELCKTWLKGVFVGHTPLEREGVLSSLGMKRNPISYW